MVVRKPVNSNPGLKVNKTISVSSIIVFVAFVLSIDFVIIKLKIEGQTTYSKPHAAKLQKSNQNSFLSSVSLIGLQELRFWGDLNLYFISMIRSILEYCSGDWVCCWEVNSATLEALQKRIRRIVVTTSSREIAMEAIKWPSLRTRCDEHILKLARKCINGRCPRHLNNYFVFNNYKYICTRSTRQSNLLHLPAMRTEEPGDLFIIVEVRFLISTVNVHKFEDITIIATSF